MRLYLFDNSEAPYHGDHRLEDPEKLNKVIASACHTSNKEWTPEPWSKLGRELILAYYEKHGIEQQFIEPYKVQERPKEPPAERRLNRAFKIDPQGYIIPMVWTAEERARFNLKEHLNPVNITDLKEKKRKRVRRDRRNDRNALI